MENIDKYPLVSQEDKEIFIGFDEVNTYFLIDECGAFLWHMNHQMSDGRIPQEQHSDIQKDINKVGQIQQFVVDNLIRFGVDPESVKDRENGDYWKWYHFWNDWKKGISDEEWNQINAMIKDGQPLDDHLPEGNWKGK